MSRIYFEKILHEIPYAFKKCNYEDYEHSLYRWLCQVLRNKFIGYSFLVNLEKWHLFLEIKKKKTSLNNPKESILFINPGYEG